MDKLEMIFFVEKGLAVQLFVSTAYEERNFRVSNMLRGRSENPKL
jgi:hypothetical protein